MSEDQNVQQDAPAQQDAQQAPSAPQVQPPAPAPQDAQAAPDQNVENVWDKRNRERQAERDAAQRELEAQNQQQ